MGHLSDFFAVGIATDLSEYSFPPPVYYLYRRRPAPIYIAVIKVVLRTCPREGIMPSVSHEET